MCRYIECNPTGRSTPGIAVICDFAGKPAEAMLVNLITLAIETEEGRLSSMVVQRKSTDFLAPVVLTVS